jgi:voltage-gated potassium channel
MRKASSTKRRVRAVVIIPREVRRRLVFSGLGFLLILTIGTIGYRVIGGPSTSLIDSFYMTFITVATIGFSEVVDLANHPLGRIFTVFVSLAGIGTMTYLVMTLTAFVVEGQINTALRRRKMEKVIERFSDHFIVCGVEGTAQHIFNELRATNRPFVVVDADRVALEKLSTTHRHLATIEGDATDNETLAAAGLARAQGLFAVTSDDNQNLVVCLTAKQVNPKARVVVSCQVLRNMDKMRKAGADAVVSPTYIGGLRMASEMIRPTVVSFLDTMMSRKEEPLRVEEVVIPASFAPRPITALNLKQYGHLLLLAVKSGGGWSYNPPRSTVVSPGEVLVIMTTPEERQQLEAAVAAAAKL